MNRHFHDHSPMSGRKPGAKISALSGAQPPTTRIPFFTTTAALILVDAAQNSSSCEKNVWKFLSLPSRLVQTLRWALISLREWSWEKFYKGVGHKNVVVTSISSLNDFGAVQSPSDQRRRSLYSTSRSFKSIKHGRVPWRVHDTKHSESPAAHPQPQSEIIALGKDN